MIGIGFGGYLVPYNYVGTIKGEYRGHGSVFGSHTDVQASVVVYRA